MRIRATLSLNSTRVPTGRDSTHITVSTVHITKAEETRRDSPSSGLPNVYRVCVTSVIFHSVHKHVIGMMIRLMKEVLI